MSAEPGAHTGRGKTMLLLLGVVWGLNWPAVKTALTGLSPWALRSIGLGAAACTVFALGLARGRRMTIRSGRDRLHVAVAGVLNIAAFNILLTFAQLGAATSRVAIITYSMPLWATLLARFALGERIDRMRAAGLLLGATGLAVLLAPLAEGGLPPGILLALGAALSWAGGTIYGKWARISAEPLAVAGWQLLTGALVALTACSASKACRTGRNGTPCIRTCCWRWATTSSSPWRWATCCGSTSSAACRWAWPRWARCWCRWWAWRAR